MPETSAARPSPPVPEARERAVLERYRRLDRLHRAEGAWYDRLGLGPRRTPSHVVLERPGMRLLSFEPEVAVGPDASPVAKAGARDAAPSLLIVPAPIKRAYLWDLSPEISVVRRALEAGVRVHLVEWLDFEGEAVDYDLPAVADGLLGLCVEAATAAAGGRPPWLAGHSLGGTLCALHAALHPDRVEGLVLVEAPLAFGAAAGALGPLVAGVSPESVQALAAGSVPGSLLAAASVAAAPKAFLAERWLDRFASLADPAALATHLRVHRWTLDELAMPGPFYAAVVLSLYREDRFARGELVLSGLPCRPDALSMPIVAVADPGSEVVPPSSAFGAIESSASTTVLRILHEDGPGVGLRHVGAIVGRKAHSELWPRILAWMADPRA
jgi:polyhydroxyalkanoate synthase